MTFWGGEVWVVWFKRGVLVWLCTGGFGMGRWVRGVCTVCAAMMILGMSPW